MSLTKRIWIDLDPAYEQVRQRQADLDREYSSGFTHRLAGRRKNAIADRPRWDPFWQASIVKASQELGIEMIWINSGACFRTAEDRDVTASAAKAIWEEKKAAWRAKVAGSFSTVRR